MNLDKLYRKAFDLACIELFFCNRFKTPGSAKSSMLCKAKKKLNEREYKKNQTKTMRTETIIQPFLQHFSDEELLREIHRREAEAKKKLVPITANIFFEVKRGDFKLINQDL